MGSPLAHQFYNNDLIWLEEKLHFSDTRITCKIKLKTVLSQGVVGFSVVSVYQNYY